MLERAVRCVCVGESSEGVVCLERLHGRCMLWGHGPCVCRGGAVK